MRAAIRASMTRTGEDLGLALRRALTGEVMRRVGRQTEQRTAGQTPDAPLAGGGPASSDDGRSVGRGKAGSVGKARSGIKKSEGRP